MSFAQLRAAIAIIFASFLLLAGPAMSAETDGAEERVRSKLLQSRPDFNISSVQASVAPGLYEVQLAGGPILYATEDGDFFILGDLYSVGVSGIVNLAEKQRDMARKELLAKVSRDDMIIFSPQGETKASVAVFTDVDCFYCQKLHSEVPAMNEAGIEVRYLAYPRAGVGSESYRKIASAWCAEDPNDAITRLKNRAEIPDNVCPGNPVADQYMLGQEAGVRGTPALVLEDGTMVPGYVSAAELAESLGVAGTN
jgi:thiol:disulfide interchange protein DsbC